MRRLWFWDGIEIWVGERRVWGLGLQIGSGFGGRVCSDAGFRSEDFGGLVVLWIQSLGPIAGFWC